MDVRTPDNTVPLAVDLDGTLIATDMLWENLFQLIRSNPLFALHAVLWVIAGGITRLKREVATRVEVDVAVLPYRDEVLQFIEAQRKAGRIVVLATATDETTMGSRPDAAVITTKRNTASACCERDVAGISVRDHSISTRSRSALSAPTWLLLPPISSTSPASMRILLMRARIIRLCRWMPSTTQPVRV